MKKALAIVMALVIALSMSAMAFAAEGDKTPATSTPNVVCGVCGSSFNAAEDLRAHIALGCDGIRNENFDAIALVCPHKGCGEAFVDEALYNEHIVICPKAPADPYDKYINLNLKDLLTMIIDLVKTNAGQWDAIESVVIRLVDFIENMGKGLVSQAEVEGAVADLETELANFSIPGVDEILNTIKSKIKNMYAGEKATTVVVETTTETTTEETTTEAVVIEDTGSASVGIAAFAAISVAAAAAYVCTKKKA